ncbi:MAG: hypothetical protein LQ346_006940 [Caloplaca aetnensis]|nr:MAG: hypothetical protein LQ346_006940 [Caloplaca aetnensis]
MIVPTHSKNPSKKEIAALLTRSGLRGKGLRKGQAAKKLQIKKMIKQLRGQKPSEGHAAQKLQIEKMINISKKAQPTSAARQSPAATPVNSSKPVGAKANFNPLQKPGNAPTTV